MKKTLLVVDDDDLIRLFSSKYFSGRDMRVLTAKHGVEAVQILKSANVDLVVTDLMMPIMNGYELLKYIGSKHPDIPTMAMTSFINSDVNERVRELGACHCIEKPFKFSVLEKKIEQLLGSDTARPERPYVFEQDDAALSYQ